MGVPSLLLNATSALYASDPEGIRLGQTWSVIDKYTHQNVLFINIGTSALLFRELLAQLGRQLIGCSPLFYLYREFDLSFEMRTAFHPNQFLLFLTFHSRYFTFTFH